MNNNIYYVYIISNWNNKVLYVGVTNNLQRRIYEHKNKLIEGFSKKYNLNKLLFFTSFNNINEAIKCEKKIKNWHKEWKLNLIKENNPKLIDLSENL